MHHLLVKGVVAAFVPILVCGLSVGLALHASAQDFESLGPGVNHDKYVDSAPVISVDGRTLIYKHDPDGGDYDIFISEFRDGAWQKSRPIKELNTDKNDSPLHLSPDGNTLFLAGSYPKLGLYQSQRTPTGWGKPTPVDFAQSFEVDEGWFYASFNTTMNTCVISNFKDLHVSFLRPDGQWSKPEKISSLSSKGSEGNAFLANDDKTLYFATDGFPGSASMDIYMSKRLDDTWQKWSEPVNLGSPVNSPDWESYYKLTARGDYAYVYSRRTGGGDLYRLKIKEAQQPEPVVLVVGQTIDSKTQQPVPSTIVYYNLATGEQVGQVTTDPTTGGNYRMVLKPGVRYALAAQAKGYFSVSDTLNLTGVQQYQEQTRVISLAPVVKGESIRLNNLFFAFGKAELQSESESELQRLYALLAQNPELVIAIGGHTDGAGSDAFNQTLSERRAQAVRDYLVGKGISEKRLTAKGYGKTKPVADNATEEGRLQNRRVEFTIIEK
jgi:outer membrane protein OmpA-like peptidoglycan-associated protein